MNKLFYLLRSLVINTPVESFARLIAGKPKKAFHSSDYWEMRYKANRTSGDGSYGHLAQFKANFINKFIEKHSIKSVIEHGCGDGNQLSLLQVENYVGLDVSETVIAKCVEKFKKDQNKKFDLAKNAGEFASELSLSLDVIYHLVEDDIFDDYMIRLFDTAQRFVIIYSSNYYETASKLNHVRHRKFTDWVEANRKNFNLIQVVENDFPHCNEKTTETSLADFYVFEQKL